MKMKISTEKIGKYLRELSVVVVGIAITFTISKWIGEKKEKKDINLYLNAVKLELEANIQRIDEPLNTLEYLAGYSRYLLSHDKKSLNPDSINSYHDIGTICTTVFRSYAFEMFKSSGNMHLMNDKEMLESLWKAYNDLEILKNMLDAYFEIKKDECKKENQLMMDGKKSDLPSLYNFYTIYSNYGVLEYCKRVSQDLKDTVSKLETSKSM